MTEAEKRKQDRIRGVFLGGAAGDALGYPVEFLTEEEIFAVYGAKGITGYAPDPETRKALISDDTQMTLFTANGILVGRTRRALRGICGPDRCYVSDAYLDWLRTQEESFGGGNNREKGRNSGTSWLLEVPELYAQRAPGMTCLSALRSFTEKEDYLLHPTNDSKGCGGVMRVAPLGLINDESSDRLDLEAAQIAAITHGHSLGYTSASVLVHLIHALLEDEDRPLMSCVEEARDAAARLFMEDEHIEKLVSVLNRAMELSKNSEEDIKNIHCLGEGWVAEETLAISVYCALRYENDFSGGIIAAVNHDGDSDSTGTVTGNILGAKLGYSGIEDKWKKNLELSSVILEMADDFGRMFSTDGPEVIADPCWEEKYVNFRRAEKAEKEC